MKTIAKKSNGTTFNFNQFQDVAISREQQQQVKGGTDGDGENIVTEDIIIQ
ncbi:MAG: hypothetical protein AAFZ15_10885 [Bacteroidota bacterium]